MGSTQNATTASEQSLLALVRACVRCGATLTGRQRLFCCDHCRARWHQGDSWADQDRYTVAVMCPNCGHQRRVRLANARRSTFTGLCADCARRSNLK